MNNLYLSNRSYKCFYKVALLSLFFQFGLINKSFTQQDFFTNKTYQKFYNKEQALSNPDKVKFLIITNKSELPEDIGIFKNIEYLAISNCELDSSLPKNLSQLKKIKELNLSGNNIREIPQFIWEMKSLEKLSFASNKIEKIDVNINSLENLNTLILQSNFLEELPIFTLSKLENLNIQNNRFSRFPTIPTCVKKLFIDNNKIENFSTDIDVEILSVGNNPFLSIPLEKEKLVKVSSVKSLYLQNSFLKDIYFLRGANNLECIDLSDNLLDSIPSFIFSLSNLKSLSISNNSITKIVIDSIISNISYLDLSNNRIREISENVGFLSNLKIVELSNNYLDDLPDEFSLLKNLVSINISNNSFTNFPEEFVVIDSLKSIQIDFTFFEVDVESEEFNRKYRWLDPLSKQNYDVTYKNGVKGISSLPETIGNMKNLEYLSLAGNNLTVLPSKIKNLKKLKFLDLTGNPINKSKIKILKRVLPSCEIISR